MKTLGLLSTATLLISFGPAIQGPPTSARPAQLLVDKPVAVMDTVLGLLHGRIQAATKRTSLPGSVVYAQDLRSGIRRQAVADPGGEYRLWLPAGTYRVAVARTGQTPVLVKPQLSLGSGIRWQLDVGLTARKTR